MRDAEQSLPDGTPVFIGARASPEPDDIAEEHGAVLPVEQVRVGAAEVGQYLVRLVSNRILPGTVVELALYDAKYRWVGADKGGEVTGPDHEGLHRVQRDHVRGAHADLQGGTFTYELPRAALSQNALPAVLVYGDHCTAAPDKD